MYWEQKDNKHFIRIADIDLIKIMFVPKGTALNKENLWYISILNSDNIVQVKGDEKDIGSIKRFAKKEYHKVLTLLNKVHIAER